MMGCFEGRGETVNSIWGLAATNWGRIDLIKPLKSWVSPSTSKERQRNSLHAPRASGPVTVMEVDLLALQDECTNAILKNVSALCAPPEEL